ncbi:MAG: hypothetical protein GY713_16750, partial [Actinomycetia bacterium]|nr:hypothetical protein [Actinomycetes bacterium]
MTSPRSLTLTALCWLLATSAVAQDDKGIQRVSIHDRQGQEVGWYDG